MRGRAVVLLQAAAVLLSITGASAQAAQKAGAAGEDGIAWLGGGDARSAEEALAQMTVGLHALGAFGLAGGVDGKQAFQGDAKLRQAFHSNLQELVAGLSPQLVSLGDDGKLNFNLGPVFKSILGTDSKLTKDAHEAPLSFDVSGALRKEGAEAGESPEIATAMLQQRIKALQGAMQQMVMQDSELLRTAKQATSPLVNEGLSLGARVAERVTQLGEILADTYPIDCGQWQWTPGGQRQKPRWVGPTFTLSTSLGTCALLAPGTGPNVIGQGSPTWTSVQLARLACQGPSVQYGFTPITYLGPSREPERLIGPECRIERKYGTEASFTIFGGPIDEPIRFNSEADFFAAMIVNKTFDFRFMEMKTFLKNTQSRIDKGHLRLEDILGLKASKGGSRGGGRSKHPEGVIDGLEEALRHSGTLAQKLGGAVKDMRARMLQKLAARLDQQRRGAGARGGKLEGEPWLETLMQRVAKGQYVNRGPEPVSQS